MAMGALRRVVLVRKTHNLQQIFAEGRAFTLPHSENFRELLHISGLFSAQVIDRLIPENRIKWNLPFGRVGSNGVPPIR